MQDFCDKNSVCCSPEMKLNIISIDLSVSSSAGDRGELFASVVPLDVLQYQ